MFSERQHQGSSRLTRRLLVCIVLLARSSHTARHPEQHRDRAALAITSNVVGQECAGSHRGSALVSLATTATTFVQTQIENKWYLVLVSAVFFVGILCGVVIHRSYAWESLEFPRTNSLEDSDTGEHADSAGKSPKGKKKTRRHVTFKAAGEAAQKD
eukprot:TRINITY_DN22381_c0_g5_i1.p1 TRINITY_DN22381_c0_g5~~TRINITY_DN22381_c0_g5_i1.p1  ORF type:complete len:170 (+),score=5.71 TRINITY_DN22381_c0_g5_i1:40-510(+)